MTDLMLAVDIGGTKISVGLVTRTGSVLARDTTATPARDGADRVIAAVASLGQRLVGSFPGNPHSILGVGVGSAGVIDPRLRRVLAATDSIEGWAGTELGLELDDAFALPVIVTNDVHAHAVGEAFVGAGRGYSTVLVAAVGTGIGGAVVLDGVPQTGTHGVAGHLGHIPTAEAAGIPCPCGKAGHVEAIASGTGLHHFFLLCGGDPAAHDSRDVLDRVATDTLARDVVVTSATALGRVLGGVVNLIDPGIVIISGGMVNAGALWWESLDQGIRETVVPILDNVAVVQAKLGDNSALIGAAKIAFDSQEPRAPQASPSKSEQGATA
jgi:glucokinase